MKINNNKEAFKNATFLGGTCATSTWRSKLIPMFGENVPYFDPQLGPGEWNDEAAALEDACKAKAKVMVFVISPEGLGTYSGWEIHETAMKAPEKMIFAALGDLGDQAKGVGKIAKGLRAMGVTVCESLEEVAAAVNARYEVKPITMDAVIAGLRFIAENRNLSTDELADGLEKLGCNWTFDDWNAQFGESSQISLFDGMRRGDISCGASVVINMGCRNDYSRHYGDDRFLSVDDETSIYHFVRRVTGDSSFTKTRFDRC